MTFIPSKRAIAMARELLAREPESFVLPLGLVATADGNQLLTLAALLVLFVQQRESCTAEVAVRLLQNDYVFDAILSAAAERERVSA